MIEQIITNGDCSDCERNIAFFDKLLDQKYRMRAALVACEDLISAWIKGPLFQHIKFEDGSPPALYLARAALEDRD